MNSTLPVYTPTQDYDMTVLLQKFFFYHFRLTLTFWAVHQKKKTGKF